MDETEVGNYYEVIGVPEDIGAEELRKAYKRARRDAHPDMPDGNPEKFRAVEKAYATLGDESKRKAYDASLHAPKQPQKPAAAPTQPRPAPAPSSRPSASQSPSRASRAPETPSAPRHRPQQATRPAPTPGSNRPQEPDIDTIVRESVPQEYVPEYRATDLKGWKFVPPAFDGLILLVSLAVMMVCAFVMQVAMDGFSAFSPRLVLLAPALVAAGALIHGLRAEDKPPVGTITAAVGALILVAPMIMDQALRSGLYVVLFVVSIAATAGAVLGAQRFSTNLKVNKRIPVKMLRQGRVYGSAAGSTPEEGVVLRNLSDAISPVTQTVDGTFMLHVSGTPAGPAKLPTAVVILSRNRALLLNFVQGAAGTFSVDHTGNIIRETAGTRTHIANRNPQALQAARTLKKQFRGLKTQSVVVLVGGTGARIENEDGGSTFITTDQTVARDLEQLLLDTGGPDVVRRDVIDYYLPVITSATD